MHVLLWSFVLFLFVFNIKHAIISFVTKINIFCSTSNVYLKATNITLKIVNIYSTFR